MFLGINALVASLDSLVIGMNFKLMKIKITNLNFVIFLISNILVYFLFLSLYRYFNWNFVNKNFSTIIYLILAYNAFKNKEEVCINKLNIFKGFMLGIINSLDGGFIALNFLNKYPIFFITSIFSFNSVTLLLLGYYLSKFFLKLKKNNLISALLFIMLAFLNYFF